MDLINLNKNDVTVRLTKDELTHLSNVFYIASKIKDGEVKFLDKYKPLYADVILIRDLCHYGHVDSFCYECYLKQRGIPDRLLANDDTNDNE